MTELPWRRIVTWATASTLVAGLAVLLHVRATGLNPLNLIQAGGGGPSAAAVVRDFPGSHLGPGIGHDGQQFYAVARQPMHWSDASADLDRPLYRLQRPLLPWLAWVLHPTGGGAGLIAALFVVGVAGLFAGAVGMSVLAASAGGSWRLGALFPLLPGSLVSLRITTADALALALALVALACLARGRDGPAVVAALAAVLAKESAFLVLAGYALWRRDRASLVTAGAGLGAALALSLALRAVLPPDVVPSREIGWPLVGLARSAQRWWGGHDLRALIWVTTAFVAAGLALFRGGLRGRYGWIIGLQLALLAVASLNVVGLDLNGSRMAMPVHVFGLLALARAMSPSPIPRKWTSSHPSARGDATGRGTGAGSVTALP